MIAVLPASPNTPTRLERLPNEPPKFKKWIDHVARDDEIHACYEASGAGYALRAGQVRLHVRHDCGFADSEAPGRPPEA